MKQNWKEQAGPRALQTHGHCDRGPDSGDIVLIVGVPYQARPLQRPAAAWPNSDMGCDPGFQPPPPLKPKPAHDAPDMPFVPGLQDQRWAHNGSIISHLLIAPCQFTHIAPCILFRQGGATQLCCILSRRCWRRAATDYGDSAATPTEVFSSCIAGRPAAC